jgi:hypothetical protein
MAAGGRLAEKIAREPGLLQALTPPLLRLAVSYDVVRY